jgi:hypothetical protein
MKTHKIAITTVAFLFMAIAAYASPIFGTWKGELNGRPITVTVTYTNGHADVSFLSDGHNLNATNAAFPKGGPPMMLRFQAANEDGKIRLVSTASTQVNFELETADGHESVLRVIDQGKTIATVKMTKTEGMK